MEKTLSKNQAPPIERSDKNDPFLKAQEAWNEVYGRTISEKRNWRSLCFVLAIVLLGAIAAIAWQGQQSKVVPYVVVLDKAGQELHTGIATKKAVNDPMVLKKELGIFVKKFRLASLDRQLMLQNIDWIYAHLLTNTSSLKKINVHFQNNNPFDLVSKETRIVDKINSILPVTDNTWSIEWQETTRGVADGEILNVAKYKAIITTLSENPKTPKQRRFNPYGIWVINFEWEKKA